jgi:cytoskeletal protein RodZ
MTNKKIEEILNKDKKFLLIMVPIIIILSLFVVYALIPSFSQGNIENNIISLIEKSTNDTISILTGEDNSNASQDDVESDVVSSQNVTNRAQNSRGTTHNPTTTDTGTVDTPATEEVISYPDVQPEAPIPVEPNYDVVAPENPETVSDGSTGG